MRFHCTHLLYVMMIPLMWWIDGITQRKRRKELGWVYELSSTSKSRLLSSVFIRFPSMSQVQTYVIAYSIIIFSVSFSSIHLNLPILFLFTIRFSIFNHTQFHFANVNMPMMKWIQFNLKENNNNNSYKSFVSTCKRSLSSRLVIFETLPSRLKRTWNLTSFFNHFFVLFLIALRLCPNVGLQFGKWKAPPILYTIYIGHSDFEYV